MTNRHRLINAVLFFAKNTKYCGKIKLFKLLYLLDFEHFRQTGKCVTGFDYQAWKFGPVPVDLMEEWEQLDPDLADVVHIVPEQIVDFTRQTVKAKNEASFDESEFTPRQLRMMRELADKYRDTMSASMIDVTHAQNGAWDKIWQGGKGAHQPIPYDLCIPDDAPEKTILLEVASELAMREASLTAEQLGAN
ncbi:putative phage-associated protein [Inhella inkyongensis]|uniref:Putative phage-associated protein n=1 Tax=Inhella inkyongensis TaxID=392593 RepID=A0A840S2R6_9BURK|nr:Panacea domain-containing protein [Inhella inkyongensis]MBB5202839.1 putative phage-associated protein [Inhella inkyongensis]